jgi:hypothetical protein
MSNLIKKKVYTVVSVDGNENKSMEDVFAITDRNRLDLASWDNMEQFMRPYIHDADNVVQILKEEPLPVYTFTEDELLAYKKQVSEIAYNQGWAGRLDMDAVAMNNAENEIKEQYLSSLTNIT